MPDFTWCSNSRACWSGVDTLVAKLVFRGVCWANIVESTVPQREFYAVHVPVQRRERDARSGQGADSSVDLCFHGFWSMLSKTVEFANKIMTLFRDKSILPRNVNGGRYVQLFWKNSVIISPLFSGGYVHGRSLKLESPCIHCPSFMKHRSWRNWGSIRLTKLEFSWTGLCGWWPKPGGCCLRGSECMGLQRL